MCKRALSGIGILQQSGKNRRSLYPESAESLLSRKIYKTGDIAKYNEYGEIIFLARKDHQIKHMGHRIELGEIETAVLSIDLVENGACIYDNDTQKIVLFYCGAEATQAYILKKLRDKVPKYMFPNVMIQMESLPQTLNGKIDRLRLREYYVQENS